MPVEQPLQHVHRIAPGIHDVPVADVEADLGRDLQQLRIFHPLNQMLVGLRRQIHQDTPLRNLGGSLDDGVQTFVLVDEHGRGVSSIKTQQRAVRSVGVEPKKRNRMVDHVLRQ